MEKLKRTVEQARAAFNTGKTRPLAFRIQQLKALKKMVQEKEKEFSAALKADLNKVGGAAFGCVDVGTKNAGDGEDTQVAVWLSECS